MTPKRPGPPPGSTRTIRIDVQYDGTHYVGWQRQAKGKSVQGVLEIALARVANEKITLFSSSRTDAGVHARQQVASFSLKDSRAPAAAFVDGTNSVLPEDVRVDRAVETDLRFHANRDAVKKTYRYFFQTGREPSVFLRRYAWHLRKEPDMRAMVKATSFLLGEHDFSTFRTRGTVTKSAVRTVLEAKWGKTALGMTCFEITANGFLKHMVRNIAGTLVEVGMGKRKPEDVKRILDSKDRTLGGKTAPPHGLFLWRVVY